MMLLILGIVVGLVAFILWFMILASDPCNTQASKDAANHVLIFGVPLSLLFLAGWWFGW